MFVIPLNQFFVYNKNQEVSFKIGTGNSILFFSMLMSGVTSMKADYSKDYITLGLSFLYFSSSIKEH